MTVELLLLCLPIGGFLLGYFLGGWAQRQSLAKEWEFVRDRERAAEQVVASATQIERAHEQHYIEKIYAASYN